MEEKLIELARVKPALYDPNHPDYFKGKVKQDIWKEIAKNLKLPNAAEVASMWQKLRNNHRDALRRQRAAVENGTAPRSIKKWRHQKQMEFLVQYMNIRPRDASLEEDRDGDISQPNFEIVNEYMMLENLVKVEDEEDEDVDVISYSDIPDLYAESSSRASDSNPSKSANSTLKKSNKKIKKQETKRQETKQQETNTATKQQNEQKVKKKRPPEDDSPNDDLYYFFLSMYETAKKMPPASQHIVRKKVFEVVSQTEADLLDIVEVSQRSHPYHSMSHITNNGRINGRMKFRKGTS